MKTLSTKTITRTTNHIKGSTVEQLKVIKASAQASLAERDPSGTQYAIAALELKLIDSIL